MEDILPQKKEQKLMMIEDIRFIEKFQRECNQRKELILMRKEDKYDQSKKFTYISQSFMGNDEKKNYFFIINELKKEMDYIDFYKSQTGGRDYIVDGISKETLRGFMRHF